MWGIRKRSSSQGPWKTLKCRCQTTVQIACRRPIQLLVLHFPLSDGLEQCATAATAATAPTSPDYFFFQFSFFFLIRHLPSWSLVQFRFVKYNNEKRQDVATHWRNILHASSHFGVGSANRFLRVNLCVAARTMRNGRKWSLRIHTQRIHITYL